VTRYKSPLRYPGGKAKLSPFVQSLFRSNGLTDGEYAEPYAGGASVALALLYEEYASRVHINDLDPSVHAFWHSALNDTESLARKVRDTLVSPAEWRRQRAVQRQPGEASTLDLAFSTFFLNRTNRSGIIASAGMIGGNGQSGAWRLDARYNAQELAQRIEKVGRYRSRIVLTNLDAIEFLAHVAATLPERSLVYLDPPYYVKGGRRLYANSYEPEDHREIAASLEEYPHPWLVSYDAAPEIIALYRGYRRSVYALPYTAAERYDGAEVMVFSNNLLVPRNAKPLIGGRRRERVSR
jgi:DNA adenine methylase